LLFNGAFHGRVMERISLLHSWRRKYLMQTLLAFSMRINEIYTVELLRVTRLILSSSDYFLISSLVWLTWLSLDSVIVLLSGQRLALSKLSVHWVPSFSYLIYEFIFLRYLKVLGLISITFPGSLNGGHHS
jgi:hypothetical protein